MQLTWLIGAPSRPASVHRRAFGQHGLGSPATQLMRAVRPLGKDEMMSDHPFGYCEQVPDLYRDLLMWLSQDVAMLHHKWRTYLGLFGSKERLDLVTETAPAAFHVLEESLRTDIIMMVCRISDPPMNGKKRNMSFGALCTLAGQSPRMSKLFAEFIDAVKPVRIVRNRQLGHTDVNTRLLPHDNLLPVISRERIERIADLAAKMLNEVLARHADQELAFHTVAYGDVDDLVFWLKQGLEHRDMKRRCPVDQAPT